MSNDTYGNLGSEMRAMKDGRAGLMAGMRDNRSRLRVQTAQALAAAEKFLGETGKANDRLAAQTRQMLAQADKDLKARTRQALGEADELVAAIRRDVAAMKADAGRILTDAGGFLSQTSSDNAKLRGQTHKMLASAHAGTKAQAHKVMVETRAAVVELKTETDRMLAEAAGMMRRLSEASRRRAAAWRNILRSLRGNGSRPCVASPGGMTTACKPARKATARRARTGGKPPGRKAA